ncbi:MAG: SCO1664 family protein [Acidimicrobiia bacterium]
MDAAGIAIPPEPDLDGASAVDVLRAGEIEVLGRLAWSSNATLLVVVRANGVEMPAIYKPRRGERPLWDFPDGTLCEREVATYELSAALDWNLVPETVLRDGPLGIGMVQRFVEHDPDEHYFVLLERHVDALRPFAAFDVLVNNADRKGGHVLRSLRRGTLHGIDHGLTFHAQWKLRTVIWDFGGERVAPELLDGVCRMLTDFDSGIARRLDSLLTPFELQALRARAAELVRDGRLPAVDPGYHSYPWPMV